jgi:hypothetical protein
MNNPWDMPNPVMRIASERDRLEAAEQALTNPGLPPNERAVQETLKIFCEGQIARWERIITALTGTTAPEPQPHVELPALPKPSQVSAPQPAPPAQPTKKRAQQTPAPKAMRSKAPPAPPAWRCADCGRHKNQSLKNADYCTDCARYQPIGATQ